MNRTRLERLQCMYSAWDNQISALVDAYLTWKHLDATEGISPPLPPLGSNCFVVKAVGITGN